MSSSTWSSNLVPFLRRMALAFLGNAEVLADDAGAEGIGSDLGGDLVAHGEGDRIVALALRFPGPGGGVGQEGGCGLGADVLGPAPEGGGHLRLLGRERDGDVALALHVVEVGETELLFEDSLAGVHGLAVGAGDRDPLGHPFGLEPLAFRAGRGIVVRPHAEDAEALIAGGTLVGAGDHASSIERSPRPARREPRGGASLQRERVAGEAWCGSTAWRLSKPGFRSDPIPCRPHYNACY